MCCIRWHKLAPHFLKISFPHHFCDPHHRLKWKMHTWSLDNDSQQTNDSLMTVNCLIDLQMTVIPPRYNFHDYSTRQGCERNWCLAFLRT
jgi:hypothetical protein